MKIAIGCDHGGFELKNEIKNHLVERGFAVEDFGITELHKVDYPEIAVKVAHAVADGKCDRGILAFLFFDGEISKKFFYAEKI